MPLAPPLIVSTNELSGASGRPVNFVWMCLPENAESARTLMLIGPLRAAIRLGSPPAPPPTRYTGPDSAPVTSGVVTFAEPTAELAGQARLCASAAAHSCGRLFASSVIDAGSVTVVVLMFACPATGVTVATRPGCVPFFVWDLPPVNFIVSFGEKPSLSQPPTWNGELTAACVPDVDVTTPAMDNGSQFVGLTR